MPRFASLIWVVCLLVVSLTACQSAPPPAPQPTAAPKTENPTAVPAAPKAAATTAPVAASGKAASSQPAQPTAPPIPTKAVAPFATATFVPQIVVEPTAGAASKTTGSAPTGSQTAAQPTAGAGASAGPQAPGVATGRRTEIKLEFVEQLGTAEQVDDIRLTLMQVPGVLDLAGNETAITVGYDAGLILPNQLGARLASMGHPIKPIAQ